MKANLPEPAEDRTAAPPAIDRVWMATALIGALILTAMTRLPTGRWDGDTN